MRVTFVRHFRDIEAIIVSFGSHLNVELQQRGIEFTQLFRGYSHLRPALLEKMPAMPKANNRNSNDVSPDDNEPLSNSLDGSESIKLTPASDSVRFNINQINSNSIEI